MLTVYIGLYMCEPYHFKNSCIVKLKYVGLLNHAIKKIVFLNCYLIYSSRRLLMNKVQPMQIEYRMCIRKQDRQICMGTRRIVWDMPPV